MSPEASMQQQAVGSADVAVELLSSGVAVLEICRPPNNFFDAHLIEEIAGVLHTLEGRDYVRSVVLASRGKHFCAGADFAGTSGAAEVSADEGARTLYAAAVKLFEGKLPIVAAIQGAAIGGGLGLALAADFRVASVESRFSANFAQLGLHHGFGLTVTLPRVVGHQRASDLLMTGRRIDGGEAYRMGLVDRLVGADAIGVTAISLAQDLAAAAPLAVQSIRRTLRSGLADEIARATEHERSEQAWLRGTRDFAEGVHASAERRAPVFTAQ
jgi:2-(1,2-epoxy-1,2-dihydrophenyl)acetyl-CoA isomerase